MSYEGPGHYQHYKGGTYEVIMLAREEATLTAVVVYRSKETGQVWTRPLVNFNELVYQPTPDDDMFATPEKSPPVVDDRPLPIPRFKFVGHSR
jgi:hypothetical protein